MMYAVRLQDLTKDFSIGFWRPRHFRALHGVTLDVAAGEVLGYLGPNGAGKTTTLKLLMQLIYPTGHPYLLDPRADAVIVSPRSPLFPLPDEPPGTTPR